MPNPPRHEDFVDLIYEAAIDASLWPRVMERFADRIGGSGATMRWYNLFTHAGAGIGVRVDQTELDRYFANFGHSNPLTTQDPVLKRHNLRTWTPKIRRDVDWLPKEAFVQTAFYNDFFQHFGFHSDISLGLMLEDVGDGVFEGAGLNVFRHRNKGAWSEDDMALCRALHPHFVRAFGLGRKLSIKQGLGDGMAEFLDQSRYGLFMLDDRGRVRHANRVGRGMITEAGGLMVSGGRLAAARSDDSRRLQLLIDRAATGAAGMRIGGSMALTTPLRRRPLSLNVLPLHGERAALFPTEPVVIVCVTDLDADVSLPEKWLRDLYGLTRAEAAVALALFEGITAAETAERLGVSLHTVRNQLRSIFEKTGVSRQAELIVQLARAIGAPSP